MSAPRYRVLLVASHPVQYGAPVFRRLSQDPRADLTVAYCSLHGAEKALDPDFGVEVQWDVPLLDGYAWRHIPNCSWRPGLARFFGLCNPGLWTLIRRERFDAVLIYTGYNFASFWIALLAAKSCGTPVLFGTDAHELRARDARAWKAFLKARVWPRLFRLADVVLVNSTGGVNLMRSLGLPDARIALTPNAVDNDWWTQQAARCDPGATRAAWRVPADAPVVLFSAKLQPWKRPLNLLRAFARVNGREAYLVFAGEGPERGALEAAARSLGVSERVRFLGFVNQSKLPETYAAADLLVLPSEYEPFGVVVNEAMLCGCPVAVSDRVGARYDLIREGETGFVFPCGDGAALAGLLQAALGDRARLKRMGQAARERMRDWSPREWAEATLRAIEQASRLKKRRKPGHPS